MRTIKDGVFPTYDVLIYNKFNGKNYKEGLIDEVTDPLYNYEYGMVRKEIHKMISVVKECLKKYNTGKDVDNLICSYATFFKRWRF